MAFVLLFLNLTKFFNNELLFTVKELNIVKAVKDATCNTIKCVLLGFSKSVVFKDKFLDFLTLILPFFAVWST